jgi:hypothetical protein
VWGKLALEGRKLVGWGCGKIDRREFVTEKKNWMEGKKLANVAIKKKQIKRLNLWPEMDFWKQNW